MNVFRRPEGRFALEALAIVAAAAIPGYLHVSWKHVLALVVAVLILSVLIETLVALRSRRRGESAEAGLLREEPVMPVEVEPEPEPEPEPVVVTAEPPAPPPTRVVEASPPPPPPKPRAPEPPQPRPQRPVPPPAPLPPPKPRDEVDDVDEVVAAIFSGTPSAPPPPPPPPPRQQPLPPPTGPWKIAQLERALRAQPNPDPELLYMIGYLRDYADADGTLPPEFDELVRDAFGRVLGLR